MGGVGVGEWGEGIGFCLDMWVGGSGYKVSGLGTRGLGFGESVQIRISGLACCDTAFEAVLLCCNNFHSVVLEVMEGSVREETGLNPDGPKPEKSLRPKPKPKP